MFLCEGALLCPLNVLLHSHDSYDSPCIFPTGSGAFRVYTHGPVIHSPTIKHQQEAISHCKICADLFPQRAEAPVVRSLGHLGPGAASEAQKKTRCDGKLLIHLLIKGHFLSAIRG